MPNLQLGLPSFTCDFNRRPKVAMPHQPTSDTSRAAAAAAVPAASRRQMQVLAAVVDAGERGATRDELADTTGLPLQSICSWARLLVRGGYLLPTDRRRNTRQGRAAEVLVASSIGRCTINHPAPAKAERRRPEIHNDETHRRQLISGATAARRQERLQRERQLAADRRHVADLEARHGATLDKMAKHQVVSLFDGKPHIQRLVRQGHADAFRWEALEVLAARKEVTTQ